MILRLLASIPVWVLNGELQVVQVVLRVLVTSIGLLLLLIKLKAFYELIGWLMAEITGNHAG